MQPVDLPLLYSFRRCPYAIRARMALTLAGIQVQVIEVSLKDKPQGLIDISPKASVPVLHLPSGQVIDESRDIMHWAFDNAESTLSDILVVPVLRQLPVPYNDN